MDYYDIVVYCGYRQMDPVWIYSYAGCIFGRAPRIKKTLPDFYENMDLDKWDTIVWCPVTRNPQEFHGLTGCQRDSRVLGRHNSTMGRMPKRVEWARTLES